MTDKGLAGWLGAVFNALPWCPVCNKWHIRPRDPTHARTLNLKCFALAKEPSP